jgi:oligopeptide transport system substrate-binding protein
MNKQIKSMLLIIISIFAVMSMVIYLGAEEQVGFAEKLTTTAESEVNVLRFNNGTEPQTLDPAVMTGVPEFRLAMQVFEGLTVYNPKDLSAMPGVAKSWKVSSDGLKWTFYLRDNAKWADGTPIDAETFRYTFLRALDPVTAADYAYQLWYIKNGAGYTNGEAEKSSVGIKVVDKYTLEITLEAPTPFFLSLTSFQTYMPVPQHKVEQYGDDKWYLKENITGNGPFKLVEWKPQDVIIMEPSETYWDKGKVKLKRIYAYPYEDDNTALEMFLNNELEFITNVPVERMDEMKKHPEYHAAPYLGTYYYRFNVTVKPLTDVRIRKALAMTVDRDYICRYIGKAGQVPAYGFVPSNMPGYGYESDLDEDTDEARKLLSDAGYPGGKGFPELTILYNTSEGHKKIAEAIQQFWKEKLGINVTLENQEWKVYLQKQDELDYQICRAGWIGDYVDPNTFLDMFVTGGGNNNTGWSNKQYDDYISKAMYEQDSKKRTGYFLKAEEILMQEMPILPIYYYVNVYMLKKNVVGIYENILDLHPFKQVEVKRR